MELHRTLTKLTLQTGKGEPLPRDFVSAPLPKACSVRQLGKDDDNTQGEGAGVLTVKTLQRGLHCGDVLPGEL